MFESLNESINKGINAVFGPPLHAVINPIHAVLNNIYMPWALICALGMFIGTMIWVYTLNEKYVNLDAPHKGWLYDLRLWTVVSMLPHLVVYLYF
ncbi:MAG: hypothetical protein AMXMBFR84_01480 [Candidatus Hydrogenedentota bacterium]